MSVAGKTVYIELVAQTKRFNAGMKKAEKGLARVKKAVGLVSAAIILVGVVALRAMSKQINEMSGELDKMAKAAKGLDVSFAFLEDVQFAFKRLGGDGGVATMTKMFKSLEKATAEAMSGSKEYTDLFDLLNINAKEFGELKQEEMVIALHRAWSKSNKTTEQAAAMGDILGRGWNKNRAVFAASTDEVLRLIDEGRKLGGFTADAGALAETLEDVKTNIEQAKRGLSNQIFLAVGPMFLDMARATQDFYTWLQKTGQMGNIFKGVMITLTAAILAAAGALIVMAAAFAGPALLAGFAAFGVFFGIAIAIGGAIAVITAHTDDLARSLEYVGIKMDKIRDFGGEVLGVLGFGTDDEFFSSGAFAGGGGVAPKTVGGGNTTRTSNSSTTVNVDARGMTAAQVNALIKQAEQQKLRNKGK